MKGLTTRQCPCLERQICKQDVCSMMMLISSPFCLQRELEKVKKRRIVSIMPHINLLILEVESRDCSQLPENKVGIFFYKDW